jgi:hypothetical protein
MDESAGSLDRLLELSDAQASEGLGDAPWPPHYAKQEGEPPRVQPSKRRGTPGSGRRQPSAPLVEVARALRREDALAGLERWKERHAAAADRLEPADVLVDAMRGRFTTWTRIRVNLRNVPEAERPVQERPDPDETPVGYAERRSK